jgi:hypothetical protein
VRERRDAEPGGGALDVRRAEPLKAVGRRERLHARVLGAEPVHVHDDAAPGRHDAFAPVGLAEPGARAGGVVGVDPALARLVR